LALDYDVMDDVPTRCFLCYLCTLVTPEFWKPFFGLLPAIFLVYIPAPSVGVKALVDATKSSTDAYEDDRSTGAPTDFLLKILHYWCNVQPSGQYRGSWRRLIRWRRQPRFVL